MPEQNSPVESNTPASDPLNTPILETKTQEVWKDIPLSSASVAQVETKIPVLDGEKKNESMLASILASESVKAEEPKEGTQKEITSMTDVIGAMLKNEYDYVKIEPSSDFVLATYVKDEKNLQEIQIKFPVYNTIMHSVKVATQLDVSTLGKVQEGKGNFKFEGKSIELSSKVAPSDNGEKLWMKAKILLVSEVKEKKKIPLGQILWFLSGLAFVALVLWGAFITFIVLNAKTIDDVKFFYSLGISLNDINTFISKVVTIIFSTLLFLETILLSIGLFKFWLTKKEFKRKKTIFWIVSLFLLIVTFSTWTAWMIIDRKVKSLPNWQEVAYGNVKILDNDKIVSGKFDIWGALITDTTKIIGPITLKYDLSLFARREEQKGNKIKKYMWDFWDGQKVEELNPTVIKKFEQKWTFNVSLSIVETDITWKEIEKKVDDVKEISILNVVKVEQKKLPNGGIEASFDASSLKDLWKIEWYFEDNLQTPIGKWETFRPAKVFYEQALIGMRIVKDGGKNDTFDKVFVVAGSDGSSINGQINAEQSLEDELSYTFRVKNIKNDFQDGFIQEFKWIIGDKEYTIKWDPNDIEASSTVKHVFSNYWKQDVKVILKDAAGNQKEITTQINITKVLKLKNSLTITNSSTNAGVENIRYDSKAHEYYITDLWSPTKLKFDAREIRADNFIYSLTDEAITWDFNGDGSKDATWKLAEYEISTPWNYIVTVEYRFQHRKIADEVIIIKEKIYIEAVKKEAQLDLKIKKTSDYVPVIVSFDASLSTVKDDNIIKFIYDYWDGRAPEERDAINPWRQYLKPWEYTVKLKVITEKGKEYTMSKKLILKSQPEIAQIGLSMKQAPVWQWIDFTSDGSSGQMNSFLWNFWDGSISTDPNPTHAYKVPWTYEVSLKIWFADNNFLEDKEQVTITD